MAKLNSLLVIIPFFTLFVLSFSVSGLNTRVGGKTEISNVKEDKEVQDLGRFSVEEFNRRYPRHGGNGELVFSEVVEAQKQVVSGIKYHLRVEATQNGLSRVFDSVVVVKPWAHSKELLNFSPISER
ncbi:hypothetical protein SLEP1_g28476 [Rubroshorea leprosula]|uniref:Cystatin domain-containing protein n=1 Tax=Rubroshorea leprosula TaxID=152421 RepID=A0AAV5K2G8_9ROSI|nr:hypothetical protein SLEP1_g28476 [Rubroshorea leprosula]